MSTSGSTDYSLTAATIIEEAFDICGIGAEGETITSDMQTRALRSLNLIVKAWGARERLWLKTEAGVTLVASQATYVLSTLFSVKPMRVLSVRRRATSGTIDTALTELSRQEYFDLPNKAGTGVPVQFYYDPQTTVGNLVVWPAPDSTTASAYTLGITYLRKIEDFDATTDDPDLPQEWLRALSYTLASELALKYGVTPDIRSEIAARAKSYMDQIEEWDNEPASIFVYPELGPC